MKLKLKLDDPHTRRVWQAALRAKAEVAAWPDWKRGGQERHSMNDDLVIELTEALEGLLATIDSRSQMKPVQQAAYFRAKRLIERLRKPSRPNGVP